MLTDRESSEIQLRLWVDGVSIYNRIRDECCPDFSCCNPGLIAAPALRQAFADAGDELRHEMLGMFLGAMLNDHYSSSVYISTGAESGPIQ